MDDVSPEVRGETADRVGAPTGKLGLYRAASLLSQYLVRMMQSLTETCEGDAAAGLILLTTAQACTQHLVNRGPREEDFDGHLYRDDLRRPVPVSAIAHSLGMPLETVRRKAIKLVKLKLMKRNAQGWIYVDQEILTRPDVAAAVIQHMSSVMRVAEELSQIYGPGTRSESEMRTGLIV